MEKSGTKSDGFSLKNGGHRPFLLIVLIFSLYLAYIIMQPFLKTIVFAIILASLLYPLQIWLVRRYGGRNNLAALTVIFVIIFVLALPTFFFASAIVNQGIDTMGRVNAWISAGNLQKLLEHERIVSWAAWLQEKFPALNYEKLNIQSSILDFTRTFGQFALKNAAGILENVVNQISHFFIMLFVVFYLVRDGDEILKQAKFLSPLREDQEDRILLGIRAVARSVLLGSFLTAVCQGIAGGIGFAIVGIPALFWGTVMAFSSLIPVIGTALVWGPATVYLMLIGKWNSAIFLLLWSILLVGSIDNFLRPFLMRGESKMSPFYVFLAIIGGVQYFGFAGILYGPLILSFVTVMLYIYGVEYRDFLSGMSHQPVPVVQEEVDE